MPDDYFPDVYMDLPLMGTSSGGMVFVLDCYDRCHIDDSTDGAYFRQSALPALTAPQNRDDLLIVRGENAGTAYEIISRGPAGSRDECASDILGVTYPGDLARYIKAETWQGGVRLILHADSLYLDEDGGRESYKKNLCAFLSGLGCGDEALETAARTPFFCFVPYFRPRNNYQEWIVCIDIAALDLVVRDGQICECHAILRISDKSELYSGIRYKPSKAYQWHITDNCDQRCRHCYLFAEDARLKCMSTPWEQLQFTLEELEEDAKRYDRVARPAITGGDPILHPDFWRFAKELHRRGMKWLIMGNPFHLDEAVCKRLYQLGCYKYQMSLDGLESFHDSLRKPGSYKATIEAVELLNDAGIQSQFMATASRQNLEDILRCMDIAVETGVNVFLFARYCATSSEKAKENYPTPEEYRDFLLRYLQKKEEYEKQGCKTEFYLKEHLFTLLRYELGEFAIPEDAKAHPDWIYGGCHLGQGTTILPNGDIMACRRMESVIGNVTTAHIADLAESDLCAGYRDISNIKKCKDCELLQFCRGCRAVGFNASGDLQAADPCCWK